MTPTEILVNQTPAKSRKALGIFNNIKFFVLCHGMLQLAQLLVSGYMKGSITTIEKRYGFTSQKSGLLAAFNEVGNTVLIVFVSFFGSRVHRPRCISIGAMIASAGVFLIALPHFVSDMYDFTDSVSNTSDDTSGLCRAFANEQNSTCNGGNDDTTLEKPIYAMLLIGQLLLGIGGVPIQPFGISYIDDYSGKRNSPLYLGILFALTVIGPAFGYVMSSLLLRLYVDIDKLSFDNIVLKNNDPRWVGAWWLGFLMAGTLLLLTSLPYLFFPKEMTREEIDEASVVPSTKNETITEKPRTVPEDDVSLNLFLKSFPKIVLRTLRNPIFLLVVLAQVNIAAMVAGLATFMGKYIERQFSRTASFSNMMMGAVNIPSAMVGIMAGGVIMRRLILSVKSMAALCSLAVFTSVLTAIPLLFLSCPKHNINYGEYSCNRACSCSTEAFNPVCGSNGVEFPSPCHAGCTGKLSTSNLLNYTGCACVEASGSFGFALQGACKIGCDDRFIPFMVLTSVTCFVAALSHTASFMMILRTVTPEDKSFALGVQFMLFRVLAFLPAPVLYGSAIDTACIKWGEKCKQKKSCQYYDLDFFKHRFLGLQIFFLFGGFVCFLMSFLVLRKTNSNQMENEKENALSKTETLAELKDVKKPLMHNEKHTV